jgi:predicted esterase
MTRGTQGSPPTSRHSLLLRNFIFYLFQTFEFEPYCYTKRNFIIMDFPRFVSSADVPHEYLDSAMLVGKIPFKALKADPRVSYTLYIPAEHLNPDPSLQSKGSDIDHVYSLPLLPLAINIHGTGRNAETCRDRLIDFAQSERMAVLAPLFPAGIDSHNDLDNYKILKYKSMRSDLLLIQMLEEVALRWPGISTEKVIMLGFSGGGQFVQRFMYLHSERLLAVSIGALGRITVLDERLKWPDGTQDLADVFGPGTKVNQESIKKLPIQLVVGSEDNVVHGVVGFWEWLEREKKKLVKEQGASFTQNNPGLSRPRMGRLDGLKKLQLMWQEAGITSRLDVVDGLGHDSGGVLDAVLGFLRLQVGGNLM